MPIKSLEQKIRALAKYVLTDESLEKLDLYVESTIGQLSTIENEIEKVNTERKQAEDEKKQAILDKAAAEKSCNEAQDQLQLKEKELERISSKNELFDSAAKKLQQENQELEAELNGKKREVSMLEAEKSNWVSDIKEIIATINEKFQSHISDNSDALNLCMAIKRLRVVSPSILEEIEQQRNKDIAAAAAETAQWQKRAQDADAALESEKEQIKSVTAAFNRKFTESSIPSNADLPTLTQALEQVSIGIKPEMFENVENELRLAHIAAAQQNQQLAETTANLKKTEEAYRQAQETLELQKIRLIEQQSETAALAAAFNRKFTDFSLPTDADLPTLVQALEQVSIGIQPEVFANVENELRLAQETTAQLNQQLTEATAGLKLKEVECQQAQEALAQQQGQLNEQQAATAALAAAFSRKFTDTSLPANADLPTLVQALEQISIGIQPEVFANVENELRLAQETTAQLNQQLTEATAGLKLKEVECQQAQEALAQQQGQLNEQQAATAALAAAFNRKFASPTLSPDANLTALADALEQVEISTGIAPEELEKVESSLKQAQATIAAQKARMEDQQSEATALIAVFNAEFSEQAVPENADLMTLAAAISNISGTQQSSTEELFQLKQALDEAAQTEARQQQQLNTIQKQTAELIKAFNEKFVDSVVAENATLSILTTALNNVELHDNTNSAVIEQLETAIEQMTKAEASLRTQLSTMQADTIAAVSAFNRKFAEHALPTTAGLAQLASAIERVSTMKFVEPENNTNHEENQEPGILTAADHLLIDSLRQFINGDGNITQGSLLRMICNKEAVFSPVGLTQANDILTKEGKGNYAGIQASLKGKLNALKGTTNPKKR